LAQSRHGRRRCRCPLSVAPLTIGIYRAPTARLDRAATAHRVKSTTAPPDVPGATCRPAELSPRPAEPVSEDHEVRQLAGPFPQRFEAKPVHDHSLRYLNKTTRSAVHGDHMHCGYENSNAGEQANAESGLAGLTASRLNGSRAKSACGRA